MAPRSVTPARRLTDEDVEKAGGVASALDAAGPGSYYGPIEGYTGDKPAVFMLLPEAERGSIRHVCSPPHVFRELEDGTLEIRASILVRDPPDGRPGWHGYLDGPTWREV